MADDRPAASKDAAGVGLSARRFDSSSADRLIETMLGAARIPGAAVAVVMDGEVVFARGYGWEDLETRRPMAASTVYPIASTTKAFTGALLGALVEDGRLAWDEPVQTYAPGFRLRDSTASVQATLRDLMAMRTGLPRHDWTWLDNPIRRPDLVARLRHLAPSAGFRERFQYSNLSVTAAAHVAEMATGQDWEALVGERLFAPLRMSATTCGPPPGGRIFSSYHEGPDRALHRSRRRWAESTAPSGGSVHSTVEDMARWLAFNLAPGATGILTPRTLAEIHAPQVPTWTDPASPTPHAAYAMGWFLDSYRGFTRLSHGGDLSDVNSEAALFPELGLGMVSFTNFGAPGFSKAINQHLFELLTGAPPLLTWQARLARYEDGIGHQRSRAAALPRIADTPRPHALERYAGVYVDAGYGAIEIFASDAGIRLRRGDIEVRLRHWHYDTWVAEGFDGAPLHAPHPFDGAERLLFETDTDGRVAAVRLPLEPAVDPIRFVREGR